MHDSTLSVSHHVLLRCRVYRCMSSCRSCSSDVLRCSSSSCVLCTRQCVQSRSTSQWSFRRAGPCAWRSDGAVSPSCYASTSAGPPCSTAPSYPSEVTAATCALTHHQRSTAVTSRWNMLGSMGRSFLTTPAGRSCWTRSVAGLVSEALRLLPVTGTRRGRWMQRERGAGCAGIGSWPRRVVTTLRRWSVL